MIDADESFEQYVVTFGGDAAVGCFTAAEPIALHRGDAVVLRTPRGVEVGEVLCPATIRQARLLGAQMRGDLLRPMDASDRRQIERLRARSREILDTATSLAGDFESLVVLDAELLFDGEQAVVQVLHPDPEGLISFVEALRARTGVEVRLSNLAAPLPAEPVDIGCGKPDCGRGEGGCTSCESGGCSSCGSEKVDLRPYFAHLRSQMEASQRVSLI
jgi:hypothetical protein